MDNKKLNCKIIDTKHSTNIFASNDATSTIGINEIGEDLTGRDSLASNVIFSWAGHFVLIISGFIMPRLIDRKLGQELLGIWDFSWSLVSYFNLLDLGIGGSVSRYVARFRIADDIEGMNRTVWSATFILGIAGILICSLTILLSLFLPSFFGTKLGENIGPAQWFVLFLGFDIGIQIGLGAFGGVLMGCHRWKLLNVITSVNYAITITAMICALLLGFGLRTLSLISLIGDALLYITRVVVSYRICKGLRLKLSFITCKMIKELYFFGGKSLIPMFSKMLLNQTTSILIIANLGPAALALYSRPRALVRHIEQLALKIAVVTRPTTSALQSAGDIDGVADLLTKSVRYSFYIVLPMLLVLALFGNAILQFWMGSRYANSSLPAILAIGSLVYLGQSPIPQVMAGLNSHGRVGIAHLITSIISAVLVVVGLKFFNFGLAWAALTVTVPMTIMNIIYLPQLVCRKVGLNTKDYILSVTTKPIIHILPFVMCLAAARIIFRNNLIVGFWVGGLSGGIILAIVYFHYVLPPYIKRRIIRLLRFNKQSYEQNTQVQ